MKKLRAGVVGCGAIAHHCHIPGYQNNKSCELVAVADPDTKNRETAMEKFGVPKGYASVEDMLDEENLDCVSIGSPNKFHAEHAIYAIKSGCHVLCEKPLCMSMKDARAIMRAAEKSDKIFMTAFTHRLYKGNEKAKRLVEKGEIGDPFMIRIRFAHQGPMAGWAMSDWFFNADKAGGGALFDMGIHGIDLATSYMGRIEKVNAMVATLQHEIELDDNAILQFTFENGALGYLEVGWTSKVGFFGVEIYGSEGALVVDYLGEAYVLTGKTLPSGKRQVRRRVIEKEPGQGGWDVEIDYFVRAIKKGEQPEIGLEAGVHALEVALGAYESSRKGKTVSLVKNTQNKST